MTALTPATTIAHQPPETAGLPHVRVAGVRVFDGDLDDAVAVLCRFIEEGRGARVATANLDFLALADKDSVLSSDLEHSTLVAADGAPVAWLARRAGAARVRRTAGVDLVSGLCKAAPPGRSLRIVLYGGTPEVAAAAGARLAAMGPHVEIAATLTPPFRPLTRQEQAGERRAITAAEPALVLVALGCPRQERLIRTYFESAPEAVWIGVGGTFDFLAGRKRRAPAWAGATGLEWIVRLAQDPRRLWRRYLVRDLPLLLRIAPRHLLRRNKRAHV